MNALSLKMAARCESAAEPLCKCRCGGALHGAKRGTGAAFFDALAADDPHFVATKARKKRERDAAVAKRYEMLGAARGGYEL